MKLVFRGGGMWDGVEIHSAHAPQEIRLSGVTFHDNEQDDAMPSSIRKTVLMSKIENQRYELDGFEGAKEDTAIYVLVQK
ncbi:MAG TPA: hypothetical protein VML55_18400 [Planctomycetaceae bacterium]|nr:hypothetical protein [Planctomycetaceae bacterium]